MVTEAGKELLRNTINTAKFHNKILEENEMWKQWELERGLTMMVSDDDVLKRIRKNHQCAKHRKKSKERFQNSDYDVPLPGPSKDVSDRWDHSGFLELYPEEVNTVKPSSSNSKEYSKKPKKKKKRKHYSESSSSSDDEIWEEFKQFKRKSKSEKETIAATKNKLSGFDNHVKEWTKHKEKFL